MPWPWGARGWMEYALTRGSSWLNGVHWPSDQGWDLRLALLGWVFIHCTYFLRARPTLGALLGLGIQPCHLGQVIDPSECQSLHLQNCEVDD